MTKWSFIIIRPPFLCVICCYFNVECWLFYYKNGIRTCICFYWCVKIWILSKYFYVINLVVLVWNFILIICIPAPYSYCIYTVGLSSHPNTQSHYLQLQQEMCGVSAPPRHLWCGVRGSWGCEAVVFHFVLYLCDEVR